MVIGINGRIIVRPTFSESAILLRWVTPRGWVWGARVGHIKVWGGDEGGKAYVARLAWRGMAFQGREQGVEALPQQASQFAICIQAARSSLSSQGLVCPPPVFG